MDNKGCCESCYNARSLTVEEENDAGLKDCVFCSKYKSFMQKDSTCGYARKGGYDD